MKVRLMIMLMGMLCVVSVVADTIRLDLPVHKEVLDNGMTVLLLERPSAPIVSCYLAFKVGAVNERTGKTGSAHLLEHMMFKGTSTIGTTDYEKELPIMQQIDELAEQMDTERALGESADATKVAQLRQQINALLDEQRQYIQSEVLWMMYTREGGQGLNAFTGSDFTCYTVNLPANRLELWAWLESDRMADPVFREFYPERDVVMEERRSRYEDQPDGAMFEHLVATAFMAHPYGWMPIGWASDISFLNRHEMLAMFRERYAPNNAVAVLVGDFEKDKVLAMMNQYFGAIPRQPDPPPVVTIEPAQRGERRTELEYDAQPALLIGWHTPGVGHPDVEPLDALSAILTDGRTSRLYRRLVVEEQLAMSIDSFCSTRKYPFLFVVSSKPRAGHTCAEIEAVVYEELARLQTEPPTEQELQQVKNRFEANWIRQLEPNSGMAHALAYYESIADWTYLQQMPERFRQIIPADVQRVAQKYLVKSNRSVVTLVPQPSSPQTAGEE